MTTTMERDMASIARMMGLSLRESIALPEAVSCASRKLGMSEDRFVQELMANVALQDYVADVCRQAAEHV